MSAVNENSNVPLAFTVLGLQARILDQLLGKFSFDFNASYAQWIASAQRPIGKDRRVKKEANVEAFRFLCAINFLVGIAFGLLTIPLHPADALWEQILLLIAVMASIWGALTFVLGTLTTHGAYLIAFKRKRTFSIVWLVAFAAISGAVFAVFVRS